jgi:hypothetical protein
MGQRTTKDVLLIRTLCLSLTSFGTVTGAVRHLTTMLAMDPQSRVGDLSNEIHAIFRRQNFKNISDLEYDALRPSLQFASLLLTTPELAGFPHAILVAPYKHVPHPEDEALDEWAFQEKGSKLSTRDMAIYNLALTTLADMVVFVAQSRTSNKTEDLGLHAGECCAERKTCWENTHFWHGSTIIFSREDVDAHIQKNYSDLYQTDLGIKWRTFETAKILLHELTHAMSHARLGWLDPIPFGLNKAVETGYEWENYIFGGVICHSNSERSEFRNADSLMIRDWPAVSITRRYQHLGYLIDVREEPSPIEMRWWLLPVESEWFDKLFTAEFWQETVPKQGLGALRAPRRRGHRVEIAEDGSATFFDSDSDNANFHGCTIPAGYMEDFDGEVVLED